MTSNILTDWKAQASLSSQNIPYEKWKQNILRNIGFINRKGLSTTSFKNQYFGKTCLIVGAGPSLDQDIMQVDSSKYFVFSSDMALKALLDKKIVPNMIVSVDAQKTVASMFDQVSISIPAVFSVHTHPDAILSHQGKKYFTSTFEDHSILKNNPKLLKALKKIMILKAGGSVMSKALLLAVFMGFKRIITIGADFSFSKNAMYCQNTYRQHIPNYFYESSNQQQLLDQGKYLLVKLNQLNQEYVTNSNYYISCRLFGEFARAFSGIDYWNASSGGILSYLEPIWKSTQLSTIHQIEDIQTIYKPIYTQIKKCMFCHTSINILNQKFTIQDFHGSLCDFCFQSFHAS